jgi:hypothetical protein
VEWGICGYCISGAFDVHCFAFFKKRPAFQIFLLKEKSIIHNAASLFPVIAIRMKPGKGVVCLILRVVQNI